MPTLTHFMLTLDNFSKYRYFISDSHDILYFKVNKYVKECYIAF
jgi:hypothetical protein